MSGDGIGDEEEPEEAGERAEPEVKSLFSLLLMLQLE